ncbi:hypothetical protein TNCV_3440611 [Trichonephila clavipes]|uniref:Uncharacterized protein n=1 Tax=Trichonephila clavipes TaxID=2585209 RepID=A0A8X6W675_TRICX|nr:hypothetical protein TNCV_3440611 [Trichonephila clavipes]
MPTYLCSSKPSIEMCFFILGKRAYFLGQTIVGLCTLHRGVQVYIKERFRVSVDLGEGEQPTRYNQTNNVERHNYRGGEIMVWAETSLGGHTDLHMICGGILTRVIFWDEINDRYW